MSGVIGNSKPTKSSKLPTAAANTQKKSNTVVSAVALSSSIKTKTKKNNSGTSAPISFAKSTSLPNLTTTTANQNLPFVPTQQSQPNLSATTSSQSLPVIATQQSQPSSPVHNDPVDLSNTSQSTAGSNIATTTSSQSFPVVATQQSQLNSSATPNIHATLSNQNVSIGPNRQSNSNTPVDTADMPHDLSLGSRSTTQQQDSSHSIRSSGSKTTMQDLLNSSSNTNLNQSRDEPSAFSATQQHEHVDETQGENINQNVEMQNAPVRKPDYELETTFYSEKDWKDFLKLENFATRSSQQLQKGLKIIHRCNQVRTTGQQCAAGGYTLRKSEFYVKEQEVTDEQRVNNAEQAEEVEERLVWEFFRKTAEHDHEGSQNKTKRLSENLTKRVVELFQLGKTPLQICYKLRENLLEIPLDDQPTYRQVYNAIETYKSQTFTKGRITMRQLEEFVNEYNTFPDEGDEDTAFIVSFSRAPSNEENQWFRMFISTRRLLRGAEGVNTIHADATHKTTAEKLPLLVVGSTDMAQRFHFIGIAITTDETSYSYEFVFQSLLYGVRIVTNTVFNPTTLVADGDAAIRNGFFRVFGYDKQTIMCYAHVMGNVQRKYTFADYRSNKEKLKQDLRVLHLSQNESTFDKGCALFIKKWEQSENAVTQRLQTSFFNQFKNWYIGVFPRVPKHNNALERCNCAIKLFQTDHKIKPLKQFMHVALAIAKQRSVSIPVDNITFEKELQISNDMWQRGKSYTKDFVHRPALDGSDSVEIFVFRTGIDRAITMEDVSAFESAEYDSFEQFTEHAFDIHKITFPNDPDNWKRAVCTCKSFNDEFICKHIIGIGCRLNAIQPPAEPEVNYHDQPLFPANRGRPKKPSKALEMQ